MFHPAKRSPAKPSFSTATPVFDNHLEDAPKGSSNTIMLRMVQWAAVICVSAAFAFAQQSETQGAKGLPMGVVQAMASDQKDFCDQWLGSYRKGCRNKFRENLWRRRLVIAPSGTEAILVDSRNRGYCGSAGCSLYLFKQASSMAFIQILGRERIGEVGTLAQVKVLEATTNGYYDLQKTWADEETTTVYKWDGSRYSHVHSK